jgi:hypothetical protein
MEKKYQHRQKSKLEIASGKESKGDNFLENRTNRSAYSEPGSDFMAKRKKINLTCTEATPDLPPEERARRIERFVNTLAKANGVKGYVGCKFFPDEDRGTVYIEES